MKTEGTVEKNNMKLVTGNEEGIGIETLLKIEGAATEIDTKFGLDITGGSI